LIIYIRISSLEECVFCKETKIIYVENSVKNEEPSIEEAANERMIAEINKKARRAANFMVYNLPES
jgi:uncharacterized SAM-dependent methyltransferase